MKHIDLILKTFMTSPLHCFVYFYFCKETQNGMDGDYIENPDVSEGTIRNMPNENGCFEFLSNAGLRREIYHVNLISISRLGLVLSGREHLGYTEHRQTWSILFDKPMDDFGFREEGKP